MLSRRVTALLQPLSAFRNLSTNRTLMSQSKTPDSCIADFCLVPLGMPSPSVSAQVAEVQRFIKKSGLKYSMHSAGTTVEGSWREVMDLIGEAHSMLHEKGIPRIHTDIRVGSRIDKEQSFDDKVEAVNKLLAKDDLIKDDETGDSDATGSDDAAKK